MTKRPISLVASAIPAIAILLAACSSEAEPTATPEPAQSGPKQYSAPPEITIDQNKSYIALFHMDDGKTFSIELLPKETPATVNNFVFLAREGFYDGVTFHRVVKGFMIQGGDPQGTGTGGPGYSFDDEPVTREYVPGTLAMANSGPNTNGSQFFVMHGNGDLAKNYTIFGLLKEGMDTVDDIANTPVSAKPGDEVSLPLNAPVIERIEIIEE